MGYPNAQIGWNQDFIDQTYNARKREYTYKKFSYALNSDMYFTLFDIIEKKGCHKNIM